MTYLTLLKDVLLISLVVAVLCLTGFLCVGLTEAVIRFIRLFRLKQEDAGAINMAVISVGFWEKYSAALQPIFKLSEDDALNKSLPNTALFQEILKRVLSTEVSGSVDAKAEHDNKPAIAQNKDSKTSPNFGKDIFSRPLSNDPITQYLAATSLYQEVHLMNHCVADAAIGEEWAPYLLRLQVSLMPLRRDLALDAYSVISFFSDPSQDGGATLGNGDSNNDSYNRRGVRVIPLLVTDNLEGILHASSADQVHQFALDSVANPRFSVRSALRGWIDRGQSSLHRDLNSTFTVARLCDNTIRCRFGASYQPQSRSGAYVMVPQTHSVNLLILVPNEVAESPWAKNRTINLCARTSMIKVKSGKELRQRREKDVLKALAKVFKDHNVYKFDSYQHMRELATIARTNDFAEFKKHLEDIAKEYGAGRNTKPSDPPSTIASFQAFWTDFLNIRNGSQYSIASFTVPRRQSGTGTQVRAASGNVRDAEPTVILSRNAAERSIIAFATKPHNNTR